MHNFKSTGSSHRYLEVLYVSKASAEHSGFVRSLYLVGAPLHGLIDCSHSTCFTKFA